MEDLLVVPFTTRKHDFHIIYLNSQDISLFTCISESEEIAPNIEGRYGNEQLEEVCEGV